MSKTTRFTLKDIEQSKVAAINPQLVVAPKVVKKAEIKPKEYSKSKEWINTRLNEWCSQNALKLETEHKFHAYRKFRFDWAILSLKIAVEYEGIFAGKSRHTTLSGYSKDTEKYNLAAIEGWRVLRYTNMTYEQLAIDLSKLTV